MTRIRALFLALACLGLLSIPDVRDLTLTWMQAERAYVEPHLIPYYERSASATIALVQYARSLNTDTAATIMVNGRPTRVVKSTPLKSVPTTEDFGLNTGPSLSAGEVEAVLTQYGSPAAGQGLGEHSVAESQRTGVDNAYWLAMFIHESGAGANPAWAGRKPGGHYTANTGNLIYAESRPNYGRFADFEDNWKAGTTAHFDLLVAYRDGIGFKKHSTIREALNTWAPPVENDTESYADFVERQTREWRQVKKNVKAEEPPAAEQPAAVSASGGKHLVTDDYRVNPNARFNTVECGTWGFQAGCQHYGTDVLGVDGQVVYAPFDGSYIMTGSYPEGGATAGQYVMMYDDQGAEIYLGHLKNAIQIEAGQRISAGTKLGEIRGDLAHTHVQLRLNGQLADWEPYYENR